MWWCITEYHSNVWQLGKSQAAKETIYMENNVFLDIIPECTVRQAFSQT